MRKPWNPLSTLLIKPVFALMMLASMLCNSGDLHALSHYSMSYNEGGLSECERKAKKKRAKARWTAYQEYVNCSPPNSTESSKCLEIYLAKLKFIEFIYDIDMFKCRVEQMF